MKDKMTAAEAKAYFAKEQKPIKAPPQKKVQSGKELMNISRSPMERIIDGLVCKVGEIVNYDKLHIEVTLDGVEYKVVVVKAN